ncbi:putative F-box domain-containing protein [Helianthus annuus]|uniref:F-box domain-containing protein n=1 Tax=Helianthus annuus TaxID=4232 RepID=A0A251TXH5_HELAN|nr:putative F-box domain-containing protein [Helianthus annuus]KAJ0526912.1 putative F-box domain-containing protein [Helianthus annuus]KAJ0535475.1 putative F-box domain-containing protein [Helianthus annuus]KAJ0543308.1 putative F-box domain-containing protein [Helianthus annuus]KAJ0708365.1 putative F-box domain-containing protein [Helianthus annuus]
MYENVNYFKIYILHIVYVSFSVIRVSMAEVVHEDLVEQILLRSEVKDLIHFKSVYKSWHSLITSPRFVNRHLKLSYNKDCCNNELNNRRICLSYSESCYGYLLVGSCNGLVCIFSYLTWTILVGNPMTREVRRLNLPSFLLDRSLCLGFGYDLSKEDYTVVVGEKKGENQASFHLLSLKSNVWRVIGELKYRLISKAGILCNVALHWLVGDNENMKKLIICYVLSREEFKEIPLLPDDARYESSSHSYLGVMEECLCIFWWSLSSCVVVWRPMKKYNVKQSCELLRRNSDMNYESIQYLRRPKNRMLNDSFFHLGESLFCGTLYVDAPIFVQSLVSPHVNGRPM